MAEAAAKRKRRNCKAAVSRCIKTLDDLIENRRSVEEVHKCMMRMNVAYEETLAKHDEVTMFIEEDDDETYAEAEVWMENVRKMYLENEMKGTNYVKSQTKDGVIASTTVDTDVSETEHYNKISCGFQMEKPRMPKFTGDVREYSTFKSDFMHIVGTRYSDRDSIALLRTSLVGKPHELITGIGNDYQAAWSYLDSIYGDPRFIADQVTRDINNFKSLRDGEDGRFCDLVHLVRRSFNSLKEINRAYDMDNNHMIALIESKMNTDDRKVWAREIQRSERPVTLALLLEWMDNEMRARLRATASLRSGSGSTVKQVAAFEVKREMANGQYSRCWVCKSNTHYVDQCQEFVSKSPADRLEMVKENQACYSCLKRASGNHNVFTCRRRRLCDQTRNGQPCSLYHNRLLHLHTTNITTSGDNLQSVGATNSQEMNTLLPTIKCKIIGKYGANQSINALYDSGSQISLVRTCVANDLNLVGKPIVITVAKVGGDIEEMHTKVYEAKLQSLDNNSVHKVQLVGMPYITESREVINVDRVADLFGIPGRKLFRDQGDIDVLLGVDNVCMHGGVTRQVGNLGARLSPLGWVICGGGTGHRQHNIVNYMQIMKPVDLTDFWTMESAGVSGKMCDCKDVRLTKEELKEAQMIEDSCTKVGNQWLVSYPWKRDPAALPDNRAQAVKRLQSLERRLEKHGSAVVTAYDDQINQLVENKFARKLSKEEVNLYEGPVHYVSHHPVFRPDNQSTPLRIVFNSSASYDGHVLNDYWCKGPDLLNNMFGVILRFRENNVALCGDISKMYHRVLIPENDQHVHRFLWRQMDIGTDPDTYVMQVVTFGDKPAPAMAQIALRKTAEENEEKYPSASRVLKENVYMDDICESVKTIKGASKITHDVDKVLSTGGFTIKKWNSNVDVNGDKSETEETVVDMVGLSSQEKVLGIVWNSNTDEFSYKVSADIYGGLKDSHVITKRQILSRIAQIFDPIGFASAFLVKAKIGMQKLWQLGLDWDDPVPMEVHGEWVVLLKEMEKLNNVQFDRCLTPPGAVGDPSLCIFSDASEEAYGACAYFRWDMENGGTEVKFVAAKSRVAPLKRITIPRLELQAALMAARLYQTIKEECRFEFSNVFFFSDSQIALAWIKSKSSNYKMFVSNRVGEIQSLTDPSQWFHVASENNVADDVSRGILISELNGRWKRGAEFLSMPVESWSHSIVDAEDPEVLREIKKGPSVFTLVMTESAIDCERFSKWRRLIRVTAWTLKFVKNLKNGIQEQRANSVTRNASKLLLMPEELHKGELHLLKEAQKSLSIKYKDGEFNGLSPFEDNDGVIRVGGRADKADMSYDCRHPAILPYGHWISMLIMRHYHSQGHSGVAATVAMVRHKFWITKAHDLAKAVKRRCVTCKKLEAKTETQVMADLPPERLAPHTPPFHHISVDYFGPYDVKIGRNKKAKYYGIIFTCLNTRAVHLEIATDYSTQEFLQALRRFFSIRGKPATLISDNGTQLVGAERELKEMINGWNSDSLRDFCAENQMEWKFVTPQAPHHNGCAESMVKGCKRAIKIALGDHVLSPFELYTCFLEVANLVNQRPIGRIPNDPDDGHYLCPNDMLLGRASSHVPQGPFRHTANPRHRVEFVQKIIDSFWRRWTRDVFPTLVPRRKWRMEKRNVRVDDVVIIMDPNSVRGKWEVGRITEVFAGRDGRVRNVKVKTAKGEYSRPITKIAVIDPAEE